jgi:hypothetical protein
MAARGQVDDRLTPPPIPTEVRGLYEVFYTLSAARRSGFGACALTFTDIESWSRLSGVDLTPWELETLIAMDAAALSVAASSTKQ